MYNRNYMTTANHKQNAIVLVNITAHQLNYQLLKTNQKWIMQFSDKIK